MAIDTELKQCKTSNSSIGSDESILEEKQVHNFAINMLKGRLFIGNFQEKRYVANVQDYRDVIVLSKDEHDLIRDLEAVRKRISNFAKGTWIGITTPETIGAPAGHCLWVELPEEIFGSHWYKIRSVRFRSNEVMVKVRAIRAVTGPKADPANVENIGSEHGENDTQNCSNNYSTCPISLVNDAEHFITQTLYKWYVNVHEVATAENIKDAIVFVALLVMTIATASVHAVQYFAEFFLKFMRELSFFIKASTPIFIACIDMFGKIVGGFYLLIAMLFRSNSRPPLLNPGEFAVRRTPMLTYGNYPQNTPRGRYPGGVKITELR